MNLAKKLAEVMAVVKHPPQTGENKFHRYKYSTRDDIFGSIRGELAVRGVVVVPSVEDVTHTPTGRVSKGGAEIIRFDVRIRILITDGEEEYVSIWWGESHTEDDKGIQQAVTQALRFWATNTFMLLDGSDEQMYQQPGTQTSAAASAPAQVKEQPPAPTTPSAKKAIANRLAACGYDPDQMRAFAAYIAATEKVENIDDVHPGKLQLWADRMNAAKDQDVKSKVDAAIAASAQQEAA